MRYGKIVSDGNGGYQLSLPLSDRLIQWVIVAIVSAVVSFAVFRTNVEAHQSNRNIHHTTYDVERIADERILPIDNRLKRIERMMDERLPRIEQSLSRIEGKLGNE